MSAVTHALAGVGFIGFIAAVSGTVIPDAPPPAPIVVHSLSFEPDTFSVRQIRTVADGDPVRMDWIARVDNAETGETVSECSGSGAYDYPAGRRDAVLSLAQWTGNDACTPSSLEPGGVYVLRAVWVAGYGVEPVRHESEPFEVSP